MQPTQTPEKKHTQDDDLPQGRRLLSEHLAAVKFIAEQFSIEPTKLEFQVEARLSKDGSAFTNAAIQQTSDYERAKIVALAAYLEADQLRESDFIEAGHPQPIKPAFQIEAIDDPLLRDTVYSHLWFEQPMADVAASQDLRLLTARQNYKRAMRAISKDDLKGWRSRKLARPKASVSEKDLLNALESPGRIPPDVQELIVDSLAAASHEASQRVSLQIGPRSVRVAKGRALIQAPKRIPQTGKRIAAETQTEYAAKRTYDVMSAEQGWSIRIVAVSPSEINIFLVGSNAVAVLGERGEILGTCTQSTPSLSLPGITLPTELTLRSMGSRG